MSIRLTAVALLLATTPDAMRAHDTVAVAASDTKPVPKDQLMVPPADAAHYVVVSDAVKHGDVWG